MDVCLNRESDHEAEIRSASENIQWGVKSVFFLRLRCVGGGQRAGGGAGSSTVYGWSPGMCLFRRWRYVTRKRREEEEGDRWLFVSRSSMSVVAGAGKPIELDGQQSREIQPGSISRRIHRGCG